MSWSETRKKFLLLEAASLVVLVALSVAAVSYVVTQGDSGDLITSFSAIIPAVLGSKSFFPVSGHSAHGCYVLATHRWNVLHTDFYFRHAANHGLHTYSDQSH